MWGTKPKIQKKCLVVFFRGRAPPVRASCIAMGALAGAVATGGPRLSYAWRTEVAIVLDDEVGEGGGEVEPSRGTRAPTGAGRTGCTHEGNQEGEVKSSEYGVHGDGIGRFQSTKKLQREPHARSRKIFSHLLLWAHLSVTTLFPVTSIHPNGRSYDLTAEKIERRDGFFSEGVQQAFII
jgi:hypothetical protein